MGFAESTRDDLTQHSLSNSQCWQAFLMVWRSTAGRPGWLGVVHTSFWQAFLVGWRSTVGRPGWLSVVHTFFFIVVRTTAPAASAIIHSLESDRRGDRAGGRASIVSARPPARFVAAWLPRSAWTSSTPGSKQGEPSTHAFTSLRSSQPA